MARYYAERYLAHARRIAAYSGGASSIIYIAILLASAIETTCVDTDRLVDLPDFRFRIDGSAICDTKPDVFFAVSSAFDHRQSRNAIRATWANLTKLSGVLSYRVAFMVGLPEQESRQSAIEKESANKGDIVQGAFVDTYSNLTYKHIMALRWATRYCPSAKFVVKIDDDVYVDVWRLADEIDRRFGLSVGTQHLICCGHVFANNTVYRDPQSKYYVTRSEWPRDGAYPPFCAGAAILYSSDVVAKMDAESQTTPYFRLDDVYVTAVLRQRLGLNMKVFEGKLEWRPNVVRRYIDAKTKPDFLFALTAEPTQILLLWQLRQSGAVSKGGGR